MSDREALAAALEEEQARALRGTFVTGVPEEFIAAARERLAQLPEKCAICNGDGFITYGDDGNARDCEICHGSGKVYRPELASTVKRGLLSVAGEVASDGSFWCPDIAQAVVAVLDALNEGTP